MQIYVEMVSVEGSMKVEIIKFKNANNTEPKILFKNKCIQPEQNFRCSYNQKNNRVVEYRSK